ncbi:MAG: hypothetical protein LBT47_02010 [Deltaproteobacteria bacterium]|jgi:hypothetical protein|nr:hypothetical protein [Deltaproteobacteria bacterium]
MLSALAASTQLALAQPAALGASALASNTFSPDQAFQQAVQDLNLQTNTDDSQRPPDNDWSLQSDPPDTDWSFSLRVPPIIAQSLLGVILAFMLWFFLKYFSSWLGQKKARPEVSPPPAPELPNQKEAEVIRHNADSLANRKLYAEAIHTLLLETIDLFKTRSHLILPIELTSREIIPILKLGDEAASAFQLLVSKVELTWFGRNPPLVGDYELCRSAHQAIWKALPTDGSQAGGR